MGTQKEQRGQEGLQDRGHGVRAKGVTERILLDRNEKIKIKMREVQKVGGLKKLRCSMVEKEWDMMNI